jgi:hypothetical protein
MDVPEIAEAGHFYSESDGATPAVAGGSDGPISVTDPTSPFTPNERTPGGDSSQVGLPSHLTDSPQGSADSGKRRFWERKPKQPKAPPADAYGKAAPKEKRPGAGKGRRMSGADTIADVWTMGANAIGQNPQHRALATVMVFQAPVAGEMLDEAAKGSFIDKLAIQPAVKARGRFDLLGAVLGPPILVAMIERDPRKADALVPLLRAQIRNALPLMVPAIRKVNAKAKAAEEAAAELFGDDMGFDPANGPVEDQIIAMIFGGMVPQSPPQPEGEPIDVEAVPQQPQEATP